MKKVYATYDWRSAVTEDAFRYCPLCAAPLQVRQTAPYPRKTCPACGYVHYRNPAPAVGILLVDGGRVFLGQRTAEPGAGKWALLSGYIEYEDDFLSAAVREVCEETGLEIALDGILDVTSSFLGPQMHYFSVHLLAHVVGGVLAPNDENAAVGWFLPSEPLPELAFQHDADLIAAFGRRALTVMPVG